MRTWFFGLHALLIAVITVVGLIFLANPCGGGDLCLGGVVALWALGFAGWGVVGLVVWRALRRAGPLLVWDAIVLAVAGDMLLSTLGLDASLLAPAAFATVLAAIAGAVLAGRAVAVHRAESVLAVVVLIFILALAGAGGLAVLLAGLLALGAGWLANRAAPPRPVAAPAGTPESPG
jgi:hypothetical protein